MGYSADSPILGQGLASAAAIDAWFASEGQKPGHVQYAPDKTYKAPPPLGDSIIGYARMWGVNSDLVAAQCLHESSAWQSAIARDKRNPAGLGAENSDATGTAYDKAITFDSPDAGIRAQVAHLCDYAIGRGAWTQYDPRYAAMVVATDKVGKAPTLRGLDGRWATPGIGYGASVAGQANSLVAFAQQTGITMSGRDARFAWKPDTTEFGYPNAGDHGRNGHALELFILHFTAGSDSESTLLGRNGSSAHYLTWPDGSPREQNVDEGDAAWTPGNEEYACRSINMEVEKEAGAPWADALVRKVANTAAPIFVRNHFMPIYRGRNAPEGVNGMIGHRDVPDPNHPGQWGGSSHHSDPGGPPDGGPEFPWPDFERYLAAEIAALTGTQPDATPAPAPNPDYFAETDKYLAAEFSARWHADGLDTWGYPISGAFNEVDLLHPADGPRLTQYFQRGILRYFPENEGQYRVQGDLLGIAELARRYNGNPPA